MNEEAERAKARVDLVRIALRAQDDGDESKEIQARLLLRDAGLRKESEEEE